MSRVLYLIFLFYCSSSFLNAQVTYRLMKTTTDSERKTYTYDNPGNILTATSENIKTGIWQNDSRSIYTYNSSGQELTSILQNWKQNAWVDSTRVNHVYDNKGNNTQTVYQDWVNGEWLNSIQNVSVYNSSNNNLLTYTNQYWFNNQWNNANRSNYSYDNSQNIIAIVSENFTNGNWINSFFITYNYNSENLQVSSLSQQWVNNAWKDFSRSSSTFINGYQIVFIVQQFDSVWNNLYKSTNTWDNSGRLTGYFVQIWGTTDWENSDRYSTVYDDSGSVISDLHEVWENGAWTNYQKHAYNYDINGNSVHGDASIWDNNLWLSSPDYLSVQYNHAKKTNYAFGKYFDAEYQIYTDVASDEIGPNSFGLEQNYPNPFNPSTTIKYSIAQEGNVRLTIYDALGSKVAVLLDEHKPSGAYSVQFDGGGLASGMYLYRLESGNYSAAKKLILIK